MADAPGDPVRRREILGWLVLLLGARLVVLFSSGHVTCYEEMHTVTAAAELARGARLPLLEYQYTHYEGGSLLIVLLSTPLVWLFGSGFWVVKLLALAETLLIGGLSWLYLDRVAGRRAARLGALLWILAPPYLIQVSLIAWGCYLETLLLGLLWLLAFERARGASEAPGLRWWFGRGLLGGLGLWVHYSFALVGLAALPTVISLWRRAGLRLSIVAAGLLGLVSGLTPWLLYNGPRGWVGLQRLAEGAPADPLREAGARLVALLGLWLPQSYHFGAAVLAWPFHLLALLLIGVALFARRDRRPLVLWMPPIYVLTLALTRYAGADLSTAGWRQLSPQSHTHLLPLLLWYPVLLALGLDALWQRRAKLAAAGLIGLAGLGLVGAVGLSTAEGGRRLQFSSGDVPHHLAFTTGHKQGRLGTDPRSLLARHPTRTCCFFAVGYGMGAASRWGPADFGARLSGLPVSLRPLAALGAGHVGDSEAWAEELRRWPAPLRAAFAVGGQMRDASRRRTVREILDAANVRAGELSPGCLRYLCSAGQLHPWPPRNLQIVHRYWPVGMSDPVPLTNLHVAAASADGVLLALTLEAQRDGSLLEKALATAEAPLLELLGRSAPPKVIGWLLDRPALSPELEVLLHALAGGEVAGLSDASGPARLAAWRHWWQQIVGKPATRDGAYLALIGLQHNGFPVPDPYALAIEDLDPLLDAITEGLNDPNIDRRLACLRLLDRLLPEVRGQDDPQVVTAALDEARRTAHDALEARWAACLSRWLRDP